MNEISSNCQLEQLSDGLNIQQSKGQICTIEQAQLYGVYDSNRIFSKNDINDDELKEIQLYNTNTNSKNLKYSICDNKGEANCALTNPWLSRINDKCSYPKSILNHLPNSFKATDTGFKKPQDIPVFFDNVCQERWYDWFTIPYYHLGNGYYTDTTTNQFYKPCTDNKIPDKNNPTKCITIPSMYFNEPVYNPIALIMLLGNTNETLKIMYNDSLSKVLSDNQTLFTIDEQDIIGSSNNIINNAETEINDYIKNFVSKDYDIQHIFEPYDYKIRLSSSPQDIKYAYDTASKLYNTSDFHTNFITPFSTLEHLKKNKQILMFKKACNVAFDGKSKYSKDIILYTLNKSMIADPISFDITTSCEIIGAILPIGQQDESNKFNTEWENQYLQTHKQDSGCVEITTTDGNFYQKVSTKVEEEGFFSKTLRSLFKGENSSYDWVYDPTFYLKNAVNLIFVFIVITFFLILVQLFWPILSNLYNSIVLACYSALFYVQDKFNPNKAPEYDKKMLILQNKYLDKKINIDKMKFGKL